MYQSYIRPLLFRMDAERAHTLSLWGARLAQGVAASWVASRFDFSDERLAQTMWGLSFPNPLGLAAGADKNGKAIRFWEAIGFGFVEIGSVSAQPCGGNPKPRAFRLPDDEAIINRMGLNNEGADAVARRLDKGEASRQRPLGVNLAKTHDPSIEGDAARADFVASFRTLAPHADYVVLNVSCPNTHEGKTFEDTDTLDALLTTIRNEQSRSPAHDVPLLVKVSPPVSDKVTYDSQLDGIVEVASAYDIDGYIATNTASDRQGLTTDADRLDAIGNGGLSGKPLEQRALHWVRHLYRRTDGAAPIIGVGGIHDADSAYARIRAGASLLQIYTALVYSGPGLVQRINRGLAERLAADGFASLSAAVGVDA